MQRQRGGDSTSAIQHQQFSTAIQRSDNSSIGDFADIVFHTVLPYRLPFPAIPHGRPCIRSRSRRRTSRRHWDHVESRPSPGNRPRPESRRPPGNKPTWKQTHPETDHPRSRPSQKQTATRKQATRTRKPALPPRGNRPKQTDSPGPAEHRNGCTADTQTKKRLDAVHRTSFAMRDKRKDPASPRF